MPIKIPSILSSMPPCPGRKFPVSFNDDFLFKREKNKSPVWQPNEVTSPIIATLRSKLLLKRYIKIIANPEEKIKDPATPEIVLLGLIFVNFGPLKVLPKTNPPMSEAMQINRIKKNNIFVDRENENVNITKLKEKI